MLTALRVQPSLRRCTQKRGKDNESDYYAFDIGYIHVYLTGECLKLHPSLELIIIRMVTAPLASPRDFHPPDIVTGKMGP